MSDTDLKNINDLARKKMKAKISKAEAMDSLVFAGILKKNGEFTNQYKNLSTVVKDHS